MPAPTYPIEKVRNMFPALKRTVNELPVAYFDGPGGSQVAGPVIRAVSEYMQKGVANLGGTYVTSRETRQIVERARASSAALLGSDCENIAFGANMTTLAFRIARALSREWREGKGNIVVTELDHHANVDPWKTAAEEKGLDVRTIQLNPDTLTLDDGKVDEVIDEQTELVAIGLASNVVGTINDVCRVVQRAKEVDALAVIDGVHAVPHFLVDFKQLGADILFCSAYKFFGPHVGIVAVKRDLLERLKMYKLKPHPGGVPEKLETGTINFEGLVGVTEAVHFIAGFGTGQSLRERIADGYKNIETHEKALADRLRAGLADIEGVTLYQAPDPIPKTPTVAFRVTGVHPVEVCHRMAEQAIHIESGNFYAMTLIDRLGFSESGGLIRAGLAPYNTEEEIDRLIDSVCSLSHNSSVEKIK